MSTILIKLSRVRARVCASLSRVRAWLVNALIKVSPYLVGLMGIVVLFFVVAALIAFPVMWTWDYVMPDVFGLPELTFWQALWGTVMCKSLFGDTGIKFKNK